MQEVVKVSKVFRRVNELDQGSDLPDGARSGCSAQR